MFITYSLLSVYVVTGNARNAFDSRPATAQENRDQESAGRIAAELQNFGGRAWSGITCRDNLGADPWHDDMKHPVSAAAAFELTREECDAIVEKYGEEHEVFICKNTGRRFDNTAPFVYVLVGLPAAGKSTWRELERQHLANNGRRVTVISSDDIIEARAKREGISYDEAFVKMDHRAITSDLQRRFTQATRNGDIIIVDRTNLTPKARREFLNDLPAAYNKIAVVFDEDKATLAARRAARQGKNIPADIIERMTRTFALPTVTEGFDWIVTSPDFSYYQQLAA